eukprot:384530-Rhodomonas_salina.2
MLISHLPVLPSTNPTPLQFSAEAQAPAPPACAAASEGCGEGRGGHGEAGEGAEGLRKLDEFVVERLRPSPRHPCPSSPSPAQHHPTSQPEHDEESGLKSGEKEQRREERGGGRGERRWGLSGAGKRRTLSSSREASFPMPSGSCASSFLNSRSFFNLPASRQPPNSMAVQHHGKRHTLD